jgi:hypothetical protein
MDRTSKCPAPQMAKRGFCKLSEEERSVIGAHFRLLEDPQHTLFQDTRKMCFSKRKRKL